jgi:hypothetical protein
VFPGMKGDTAFCRGLLVSPGLTVGVDAVCERIDRSPPGCYSLALHRRQTADESLVDLSAAFRGDDAGGRGDTVRMRGSELPVGQRLVDTVHVLDQDLGVSESAQCVCRRDPFPQGDLRTCHVPRTFRPGRCMVMVRTGRVGGQDVLLDGSSESDAHLGACCRRSTVEASESVEDLPCCSDTIGRRSGSLTGPARQTRSSGAPQQ